jgi:hypothetical protein
MDRYISGGALTPETLNGIGWTLSFHWRNAEDAEWYNHPAVDMVRAYEFFERAANLGLWNAKNNLAVLCRDGLGVQKDPQKAFDLFFGAANSLDPVPLRHLATCYREGKGTKQDTAQADYLDELATLRQSEQDDQVKRLIHTRAKLRSVGVRR